MTWLPTFLNWPAALVAAALAVPALFILYFLKLRRQTRPVSSTILWKKAVQDLQVNSPFQKLRRNLLLLLQLLILAAILLALANPITFYRPGAAMNTVILLDHSASMNARDGDGGKTARTRLDDAKRRAVDLVDNLPRGGRAMVIAFNDTAETMQPYTADVPALKRAIEKVEPTDRPSELKLAYQLADAQSVGDENSGSRQRVFLFSDGRIRDAAEVSLRGELRYEACGDANSKNIGIVSLSARRNYETPTQVQVFARLANFGPEPVETDCTLSVASLEEPGEADDYQVRQIKSGMKLLPVRWTDAQRAEAEKNGDVGNDSVEFTLELTTAAVLKLEQTRLDGDVLSADDAACVVVPPPKPLNLALVTDGNYFLEKLIASLPLKAPKTLTPADWESKPPTDVDVVIFDRYVPRVTPVVGNFVYVGAVPGDLPTKQEKDDAGVALFDKDQTVLDWRREHPVLRDVAQLRRLYAGETLRLSVPLGDEVLIDGADGPMVVIDRAGRATNLIVAFDLLQSNWPLLKGFPVFMQQAIDYLVAGSNLGVRESFVPGDSPRLPRANLERAGADLKSLTLTGPDGDRHVEVPPSGDFALPAVGRVGVYQTRPGVPQYERLAVNLLSEVESNTQPTDTAPGNNAAAQAEAGQRTPLNWWWWLIAAVGVPVLLVEWWVYAKRVHA